MKILKNSDSNTVSEIMKNNIEEIIIGIFSL